MSVSVATWKGPTDSLVEFIDSPSYEFAEKSTKTRRYKGAFALCVSSAPACGAVGTGDDAGYIVAKSTVGKERGGSGLLTIVYEAGGGSGQPLPPDDYGLDPFEINPRIERNPIFANVTSNELGAIQAQLNGATSELRDEARAELFKDGVSDEAKVLWDCMRKGAQNYIQSGFKYYWTVAYYSIPALTAGTYIEFPSGPLAPYLGTTMDWLRLSDKLVWSDSIVKVTRTWMGAPGGYWDPLLYGT